MDTLVPPYVHAGGQLQTVEEFLIVGRDESYPVVVVSVLAYDEFRPVFGGGIDLLYHAVVEHAGDGVAEGGCHHAVVDTPCEVAITVSRVQSVLGVASEAASDRGIYGSGQAAEVVNLPYVVQTYLGLVVFVVVGARLFAAFVASVGRVVLPAVHAGRHVLRHAVPFRQRQRARRARRTGPVPLRSTEAGEGELVVVVDALGDISEIAVSTKACTLYVSVTPSAATHDGECPAVLHQSRRDGEQHFVVAVITHGVRDRTAFLGVYASCDDIDRTAHRRSGQFGSTHAALGLHDRSDVSQSLPVGPIDGAALHVIHRHAVDHGSDVGVVESSHPDLRVTPSAALSVGMHTRCALQHLRKLLTCQPLLDLQRGDLADRHRRLLRARHLARDRHVLQGDSLRLQFDDTEINAFFFRLWTFDHQSLITHIRQLQRSSGGYVECEITIQIGGVTVGSTGFQNRHADEFLTGLRVADASCHFLRLSEHTARRKQAQHKGNKFSHNSQFIIHNLSFDFCLSTFD